MFSREVRFFVAEASQFSFQWPEPVSSVFNGRSQSVQISIVEAMKSNFSGRSQGQGGPQELRQVGFQQISVIKNQSKGLLEFSRIQKIQDRTSGGAGSNHRTWPTSRQWLPSVSPGRKAATKRCQRRDLTSKRDGWIGSHTLRVLLLGIPTTRA